MKLRYYGALSLAALTLAFVSNSGRTKTLSTESMAAARAEVQATRQSPLPAPTGTYSVGRTHFDWTDQSRTDPENPSGHREIIVWVWYPAALPAKAEPAEWMPAKWGELFRSDYLSRHPDAAAKSGGL